MRLRNPRVSRKGAFHAALALAGMTQRDWANQEGVTGGHVTLVLSGRRTSKSLTDKIDAFIREYLPTYRAAVELAKSA